MANSYITFYMMGGLIKYEDKYILPGKEYMSYSDMKCKGCSIFYLPKYCHYHEIINENLPLKYFLWILGIFKINALISIVESNNI